MHNTLAASDYGLIDEKTFEPRPNYWAALFWRKLMGTTVLDAGNRLCRACMCTRIACAAGPAASRCWLSIRIAQKHIRLKFAAASERYTFTAQDLMSQQIQLNGSELKLGDSEALPELTGAPAPAGKITFAPASITFLALPSAQNASCQP